VYDCARESVEDTLGCKNIVQLSIDRPDFNWNFPASLEKRE